jgi:hypothetical protein
MDTLTKSIEISLPSDINFDTLLDFLKTHYASILYIKYMKSSNFFYAIFDSSTSISEEDLEQKIQTYISQHQILSIEQAWSTLRLERNKRLSECDWTQLSDVPLSQSEKSDWIDYRQDLRNLPSNTIDPFFPVWPTIPQTT